MEISNIPPNREIAAAIRERILTTVQFRSTL